jgi:amino acid adenylation domain-containing protein
MPESFSPCAPRPALATSIAARIARHAAATPERVAVVDGSSALTFSALERRSNQVAVHLCAAGAGPECCVGVLLERSTEFVVAALAVLKAGAAYLPLDPSTPAERTAFILTDAGAPLLLTHRDRARDLPAGAWRVLDLEGPELANSEAQPDAAPILEPVPASVAYVIYTSGSTGRPKGVEITHGNLANLIDWHQAAFAVTAADRASQVAGPGFDAAVWEIWPHLTAGASVHVADELTRRSAPALRDWLVAERITISFVPTLLAEQLLHAHWPAATGLRFLLTGADRLRRRPEAELPFALVNNYGPTECTVVATSGIVQAHQSVRKKRGQSPQNRGTVPFFSERSKDEDGPPSIGRPIANTTVLILDDNLRPVPAGGVGELCLAGALIGRGYRNNPALTAERFVTYQATAEAAGVRLYRTGDRGRLLTSGEIAFLGRLDEQVKVRGYRIELGEIAACLDRCPGIEACAVTACDSGEGLELVAYVVASPGAGLTALGLRKALAAHLPDYMIPVHFVGLAALPMTANGKLDKSALPAPDADNLLPNQPNNHRPSQGAPARGGLVAYQEQIAALVASLLGQPAVGTEENFFMLGGHSMLGAQLVARIRDLFSVKLTLRQLFAGPTVAALAAEVSRLCGQQG